MVPIISEDETDCEVEGVKKDGLGTEEVVSK